MGQGLHRVQMEGLEVNKTETEISWLKNNKDIDGLRIGLYPDRKEIKPRIYTNS